MVATRDWSAGSVLHACIHQASNLPVAVEPIRLPLTHACYSSALQTELSALMAAAQLCSRQAGQLSALDSEVAKLQSMLVLVEKHIKAGVQPEQVRMCAKQRAGCLAGQQHCCLLSCALRLVHSPHPTPHTLVTPFPATARLLLNACPAAV